MTSNQAGGETAIDITQSEAYIRSIAVQGNHPFAIARAALSEATSICDRFISIAEQQYKRGQRITYEGQFKIAAMKQCADTIFALREKLEITP